MSWFDRFLRRSSEAGGAGIGMDATATTGGLVEAEVLMPDGWHIARFRVAAPRVSDALNDLDADLDARLDDGSPIDLDRALLVVPPERPAGDPARRLHRPVHQLWVRIGEWAISGSLHLPPGTVGSAYLLRRNHQFFVMTNAKAVRAVANGREERVVPVLLVNLQQVSSLRDTPEPEVQPALEVPSA